MTTIAYKDGVMAADSKCTDEYMAFLTRTQKIFRLANGALIGTAGDADARELMDLLAKSTWKRLPSKGDLAATKTNFAGILAFPNGKVFLVDVGTHDVGSMDSEWTASILEVEERMCAVGSGQQFAIGAMAAGKSAHDAVVIACRYCSFSQPPVKEVPVKPVPKKVLDKRARKS